MELGEEDLAAINEISGQDYVEGRYTCRQFSIDLICRLRHLLPSLVEIFADRSLRHSVVQVGDGDDAQIIEPQTGEFFAPEEARQHFARQFQTDEIHLEVTPMFRPSQVVQFDALDVPDGDYY